MTIPGLQKAAIILVSALLLSTSTPVFAQSSMLMNQQRMMNMQRQQQMRQQQMRQQQMRQQQMRQQQMRQQQMRQQQMRQQQMRQQQVRQQQMRQQQQARQRQQITQKRGVSPSPALKGAVGARTPLANRSAGNRVASGAAVRKAPIRRLATSSKARQAALNKQRDVRVRDGKLKLKRLDEKRLRDRQKLKRDNETSSTGTRSAVMLGGSARAGALAVPRAIPGARSPAVGGAGRSGSGRSTAGAGGRGGGGGVIGRGTTSGGDSGGLTARFNRAAGSGGGGSTGGATAPMRQQINQVRKSLNLPKGVTVSKQALAPLKTATGGLQKQLSKQASRERFNVRKDGLAYRNNSTLLKRDLAKLGAKTEPTRAKDLSKVSESGTVYRGLNAPAGKRIDVRVMSGDKKGFRPRAVVTKTSKQENQWANANGKAFKGNVKKSVQRAKSHIELNLPRAPAAFAKSAGKSLLGGSFKKVAPVSSSTTTQLARRPTSKPTPSLLQRVNQTRRSLNSKAVNRVPRQGIAAATGKLSRSTNKAGQLLRKKEAIKLQPKNEYTPPPPTMPGAKGVARTAMTNGLQNAGAAAARNNGTAGKAAPLPRPNFMAEPGALTKAFPTSRKTFNWSVQ